MSKKGSGSECSRGGDCHQPEDDADSRLRMRLAKIRHKVLVLSGKGGVGKSTVAVNLAVALALEGKRVGLLDVDFHGPSVPTLLGLKKRQAVTGEDGLLPLEVMGVKVMSIAFLLGGTDEAVIWRGPMKAGAIKQLLADVAWGELDFLIIDLPPGTGDEPLSVCQLIDSADGAVIVTTPQEVSLSDVRRSITFCRQLDLPVLGVIENMSGFVCPKCGDVIDIFKRGGGQDMATTAGVPFLGRIPLDPAIAHAGDEGKAFAGQTGKTEAGKAFARAILPIMELSTCDETVSSTNQERTSPMRIAIPVAEGRLAMHFGHCETFALFDVDPETKEMTGRSDLTPPPHAPGVLPKWLAEQGATVIIAGGMGSRAKDLFTQNSIDVIVGAPSENPERLVKSYLAGALQTGDNVCDH